MGELNSRVVKWLNKRFTDNSAVPVACPHGKLTHHFELRRHRMMVVLDQFDGVGCGVKAALQGEEHHLEYNTINATFLCFY